MSQWGHDFRPDYFRLADAARWLGADAIVASTATATPQVAADIVARLGLRDPVRVATGFDRPNLSFAVVPCANKAGRPPRDRRRARRAGRAARASSTRARARRASGSPAGSPTSSAWRRSPTTPACRARRAPRRSAASWPARRRSSSPPTRSGWASTRPTCGRSATRASRARSRRTTRRPAARGATGSPARCLVFATGKDKGLHVFFIERSTVEEDALKAVARRIIARRAGRRRSLRPPDRRPAGGDEEVVRAIVGHLARAGVVQPAPSRARPRRRPARRAVGRPRARALPHLRPGGHARPLAPVPRGVGVGRGLEVPARGDPAPLRRPLDARADRPVLRRLRPVARARAAGARRARAPAAGRRSSPTARPPRASSARSTRRSSTSSPPPSPRSGRTRAVEILRGGRSKVDRASTPTTACRTTARGRT